MTTAKIVFTSTATAPLFAHYQGQVQPQPAYVSLDLNTGEIDADYSGEIGNGMPADVWHGVVRRYKIAVDLTADQVTKLLDDIKPKLQRVLDGSEVVWDGSNWVGELDEDAANAEDELNMVSPFGTEMGGLVITDLAEWLANGGEESWLPEADADIAEFIRDFDLDGYVAGEDIGDTLMDMWANRLYNGEPLPTNVAQALIEDGRCDDSAWTDELAANARGETHENQD